VAGRKRRSGKREWLNTGRVVANGEVIQHLSLLDAEPTRWDHHTQDLLESTILGFPSFKRNLHRFVRIVAQAKAELISPKFNFSDSEVPANSNMMALNI
jgi:hypothetical protein